MPAAVFLEIRFDFFRFFQHVRELGLFRFVKAVVTDAEHPEGIRQKRDDPFKIAFPVAAGAGKQQNDRCIFRTK